MAQPDRSHPGSRRPTVDLALVAVLVDGALGAGAGLASRSWASRRARSQSIAGGGWGGLGVGGPLVVPQRGEDLDHRGVPVPSRGHGARFEAEPGDEQPHPVPAARPSGIAASGAVREGQWIGPRSCPKVRSKGSTPKSSGSSFAAAVIAGCPGDARLLVCLAVSFSRFTSGPRRVGGLVRGAGAEPGDDPGGRGGPPEPAPGGGRVEDGVQLPVVPGAERDQVLGLLPAQAHVGDVVQVPGLERPPAPAHQRTPAGSRRRSASAAYQLLSLGLPGYRTHVRVVGCARGRSAPPATSGYRRPTHRAPPGRATDGARVRAGWHRGSPPRARTGRCGAGSRRGGSVHGVIVRMIGRAERSSRIAVPNGRVRSWRGSSTGTSVVDVEVDERRPSPPTLVEVCVFAAVAR